LGRVDPALDLDPYLSFVAEAPKPLDPRDLFKRPAPLEIEVGCGKGLFMVAASKGQPEVNFLGVEVAKRYAEFCAAKLAKADVDNATMYSGDAEVLFGQHLVDACATAVHVYFPDPWWKRCHWKRRIMNATFLEQVQRVLSPGGVLHFWTDVAEYFKIGVQKVEAATQLQPLPPPAEKPAEFDFDYRTHFERRTRKNQQPVHRARFCKQ